MKTFAALFLLLPLALSAGSIEDLRSSGDSSWSDANAKLNSASNAARQAGRGDLANRIDSLRNKMNSEWAKSRASLYNNSSTSSALDSSTSFSSFGKSGSFADPANMGNFSKDPIYNADGTLHNYKSVNSDFKAFRPAAEVLAENTRLTKSQKKDELSAPVASLKKDAPKKERLSQKDIDSALGVYPSKSADDGELHVSGNAVVDPMEISKDRIAREQESEKYRNIGKDKADLAYQQQLYEKRKAEAAKEGSHLTAPLGTSGIKGVAESGGDNSVYLGNTSGVVMIPSDPGYSEPSVKKSYVPPLK